MLVEEARVYPSGKNSIKLDALSAMADGAYVICLKGAERQVRRRLVQLMR